MLTAEWEILTQNIRVFFKDFDYHLPIGSVFNYEVAKQSKEFNNPNFSLGWEYLQPDNYVLFLEDKLEKCQTNQKLVFVGLSKSLV